MDLYYLVSHFEQIGRPEMYENHCKLKADRESERKMELAHKNYTDRLEQEMQKNERLEIDVRNFEERRRHLEKVKILQMKRPWVVSGNLFSCTVRVSILSCKQCQGLCKG